MALTSYILQTCFLIIFSTCDTFAQQPNNDRHIYPNHRMVWPVWYHDKLVPTRHDRDGRQFFQEVTTKNWNREDLTERPTSTILPKLMQNRPLRHHVEHHHLEQRPSTVRPEKFSALAVAEYGGTRAIAYAGYHNNNRRHQLREAVTQNYQRVTPTMPTYTKHHSGRRVCSRQAPTTVAHHHRGRQIRLVYTELSSGFLCCPGWTQMTHLSFGCNKPTCAAPCLNGGICSAPGKCTCPKGFTGSQCQTDIDECVTEKPCGQLCRNLPGTYECHCRPGFELQKDGQSCRKNDSDGTAFEARDLENNFHEVSTTTKRPSTFPHDTENEVGDVDLDQDYEIILKRLTKLEKQVAKGKKRDTETTEMNTKITLAVESINEIKRAVENVQLMQQELYDMRSKMKEYELEARKIQHLTNRVAELEGRLRLRCRSIIPISSGSLNL